MEDQKNINEEVLEDQDEKFMAEDENAKEDILKDEVDFKIQFNDLNDKFLRLNAEFMNYKKRTEKEKSDIYKYANEKIFVELLPVIDNMERALSSIEGAEDHKSVIEGVNLIKKSFDEFLKKNGIEIIPAKGEKFDPNYHHAVMTEENEEVEDDTVIDEFQSGYKLNNKVIRHSMVKVSKKSE
ncbi:MAG: nucleotide exchange factor GrpE [Clostridiales bacterium]|nr:nucleotide exchange factor GrpE [Clostridiales bacterium]